MFDLPLFDLRSLPSALNALACCRNRHAAATPLCPITRRALGARHSPRPGCRPPFQLPCLNHALAARAAGRAREGAAAGLPEPFAGCRPRHACSRGPPHCRGRAATARCHLPARRELCRGCGRRGRAGRFGTAGGGGAARGACVGAGAPSASAHAAGAAQAQGAGLSGGEAAVCGGRVTSAAAEAAALRHRRRGARRRRVCCGVRAAGAGDARARGRRRARSGQR
jgi:hypothetical protein